MRFEVLNKKKLEKNYRNLLYVHIPFFPVASRVIMQRYEIIHSGI